MTNAVKRENQMIMNEQTLIALYMTLTGGSEDLARGVFMYLNVRLHTD